MLYYRAGGGGGGGEGERRAKQMDPNVKSPGRFLSTDILHEACRSCKRHDEVARANN